MRPRGLRASWKKVTNTFGYECKEPTRADELKRALKEEGESDSHMQVVRDQD
jgi:hypothetical protein